MANTVYRSGLEHILRGEVVYQTDTIKAAIGRGGAFNAAHTQLADLTGGTWTSVANFTLASKTTTDATADAADGTFGTIAAGADLTSIVLYAEKTAGTDVNPLLVWFDTGTGLPLTPTGAAVNLTWVDTINKIFRL